jgi:multiple sugar transport system permease protein
MASVQNVIVAREGQRRANALGAIERRRARWAYVFIAPHLLFILVFSFIPMLIAFYLAFTEYSVLQPPRWVGLDNFERIFRDRTFLISVRNTMYLLAVTTPVRLFLGLGIALLLNQQLRFRSFFRTVVFLPWIASGVVVASIWSWLYNVDAGVLNYLLLQFGLPRSLWLTSVDTAMPGIIIAALWRSTGWVVVLYLAGLQGIPAEYYEAAHIDGANAWQRLRHITWPLLQPTTLLILITTMIGSFQMFDLVYVMTSGGPRSATTVMAHQIYENAFTFLKMGYASAQAFVLFAVIAVLSFVSFRSARSRAD